MKTDFYTKTVLTVIAVCLIVLVGKELQLIPSAEASSDSVMKVDIVKINGTSVSYGTLPVKIKDN